MENFMCFGERAAAGVALAGILAVSASSPSRAAPPNQGPQQVVVTNTDTQPVPVTAVGTTTVTGTVTANLSSNQVIVGNTAPIRTVNAATYVHFSATINVPAGGSFFGANAFAVPAGKRLIIDFVSAGTSVLPSGDFLVLFVQWGGTLSGGQGTNQRHALITTPLPNGSYIASQPLTMVFEPLDIVQLGAAHAPTSAAASAELDVTGHLIDAN